MSSPTAASIWGTGRTANPMVMGFTLVMAKLGMQVHLRMESNTEEVHTTLMVANTSATLRRGNSWEMGFSNVIENQNILENLEMGRRMARGQNILRMDAFFLGSGRMTSSKTKVFYLVRMGLNIKVSFVTV